MKSFNILIRDNVLGENFYRSFHASNREKALVKAKDFCARFNITSTKVLEVI